MARRSFEGREARQLVATASETVCETCGRELKIFEHRPRYVKRLDGLVHLVRRDKRCKDKGCPGYARIFRPLEDVRLALPRVKFGLDVVLAVGERHLKAESLRAIGRDLVAKGVPIAQTHVGRLFRSFMSLTELARGDGRRLQKKLRKQGGIVLMADGVQFDPHSPVLYVLWDAISGEPLFAERMEYRSAEDICPLLERVKAMGVKVIGIVSDKEKGLVPAIAKVFPDVPHQFCQTHFLKNCAKALDKDLGALGTSVTSRGDRVRKIGKRLHDESRARRKTPSRLDEASLPDVSSEGPLSEEQLVQELCSIAHDAVRATGKAPLSPPELVRHAKLEIIRETAQAALDVARQPERDASTRPCPARCSSSSWSLWLRVRTQSRSPAALASTSRSSGDWRTSSRVPLVARIGLAPAQRLKQGSTRTSPRSRRRRFGHIRIPGPRNSSITCSSWSSDTAPTSSTASMIPGFRGRRMNWKASSAE